MDLPPGSTPDFFCCVLYWVFGRGLFFPEVFHPFGWFPLTFFASLPFPIHTPGEWVVLPDPEVRSGGGVGSKKDSIYPCSTVIWVWFGGTLSGPEVYTCRV